MAKHKKWSSKVKLQIALEALKGKVTINEICNRYEVAPSQVHAWKKQLIDQGTELFEKPNNPKNKKARSNNERVQKSLYEKIGQLTVECDFLKKSWEKLQGNTDED